VRLRPSLGQQPERRRRSRWPGKAACSCAGSATSWCAYTHPSPIPTPRSREVRLSSTARSSRTLPRSSVSSHARPVVPGPRGRGAAARDAATRREHALAPVKPQFELGLCRAARRRRVARRTRRACMRWIRSRRLDGRGSDRVSGPGQPRCEGVPRACLARRGSTALFRAAPPFTPRRRNEGSGAVAEAAFLQQLEVQANDRERALSASHSIVNAPWKISTETASTCIATEPRLCPRPETVRRVPRNCRTSGLCRPAVKFKGGLCRNDSHARWQRCWREAWR
jgi:hypothetical protein